ncbi:MAG: hypothetical protein JNK19_01330, partial [Tabrizicola sp.]|nr:hypothetical protein [Tabrizicola sp.]
MNRPFPLIYATFQAVLICLVAIDLTLIGVNLVGFLLQKAGVIAAVPEYLKITQDRALPEDFN